MIGRFILACIECIEPSAEYDTNRVMKPHYWDVQKAIESLASKKSKVPPAPPKCSVTIGILNPPVAYTAMSPPLPTVIRFKIVRLLLLHWRLDVIAAVVHCHSATIYNMQENIFVYGTVRRPTFRARGAPRALHKAIEDSLIVWLEEQSWAVQKEMM